LCLKKKKEFFSLNGGLDPAKESFIKIYKEAGGFPIEWQAFQVEGLPKRFELGKFLFCFVFLC
jgi:hypothetical protein